MLLDFPDTIFGNCAPHKLPFSHSIDENISLYLNKTTKYIFKLYITITIYSYLTNIWVIQNILRL